MPKTDATWVMPPDDHPAPTGPIHHRYRADYGAADTACTCDGQSTCCSCNACFGCDQCETDEEN